MLDNVDSCESCDLRKSCKSPVSGEGSHEAQVMFLGEAPGAEEDEQSRPFVGKAGKILDKAIDFAGLTREDVYITNLVKCRPETNRTPEKNEILICAPWFIEELFVIKPKILVTLGKVASEYVVSQEVKITEHHGDTQDLMIIKLTESMKEKEIVSMATGEFSDWTEHGHMMKWIPFLHPAWLLRNYSEEKKEEYKKGLEALKEAVDNLEEKA